MVLGTTVLPAAGPLSGGLLGLLAGAAVPIASLILRRLLRKKVDPIRPADEISTA
jgi:hypothetical protein